ncbi:hypothetical protein KI387_027931, partial [Taxus chinensis]
DVPSFGSHAKATRVQAFLASRGPKFDSTGFKNRTPVIGIYVPAAHTCNQALHIHIKPLVRFKSKSTQKSQEDLSILWINEIDS